MKKVLLLSVSLLSCLPLAAESADVEAFTKAVLDNNLQQVRSSLGVEYSQEDLKIALGMAKEKNKFYHERLKRWKNGFKVALLGVPISTVLGAILGIKSVDLEKLHHDGSAFIEIFGMGYVASMTGLTTTIAIAKWVHTNVEKWQSLTNKSDWIVHLINKRLKEMQ